MMDLLSLLPTYLVALLAVIGACSVAVKAVAPLTKTDRDDALARALDKLHALLSALALNPKK